MPRATAGPFAGARTKPENTVGISTHVDNRRDIRKHLASELHEVQDELRLFVGPPNNVHSDFGRRFHEGQSNQPVREGWMTGVLADGEINPFAGLDQDSASLVVRHGLRGNYLGGKAALTVEFDGPVVGARRDIAMNKEQRFVFQMFQTQVPAFCERAGPAQDHGHPFLEELFGGEFQTVDRGARKPHIDLARDHRFRLESGHDVLDVDLHTGKETQIPVNDTADNVSESFAEPNPHRTELTVLRVAGDFHGPRGVLEYGAGFMQKAQAGIGKKDPARIPIEKPHSNFSFEALNLAAERRLGDLEPPRGFREVKFFRHRNEVAQLAKLHGAHLIRTRQYPSSMASMCVWY